MIINQLPGTKTTADTLVQSTATKTNQAPNIVANSNIVSSNASVQLTNSLQSLLAKLVFTYQQQQNILNSLPPQIRALAQTILQQNMPNTSTVEQGLAAIIKSQQATADQLIAVANTLQDIKAPDKESQGPQQQLQQILGEELELINITPEKAIISAQKLKELATMVKKSIVQNNDTSDNYTKSFKSVTYSMPLYIEQAPTPYIAYINIYHEHEKDNASGDGDNPLKSDTWLRISLVTENIGTVDLIFHLYNKKMLNINIGFPSTEAVDKFDEYLPQLRSSLKDSTLELADITLTQVMYDR